VWFQTSSTFAFGPSQVGQLRVASFFCIISALGVHMAREEDRDDVELGEMEGDAFIDSGRYASKDYDRPGFATRWIPPRLREFVENLSRIKVSS